MENTRRVHKLLSVFDVLNCRPILVQDRSSIRVLFEYDADSEKKNFTILSKGITEETRKLLTGMLTENVSSDKIIYGLDSNNLDYNEIVSCRRLMSS
jgi:hypothetical protein